MSDFARRMHIVPHTGWTEARRREEKSFGQDRSSLRCVYMATSLRDAPDSAICTTAQSIRGGRRGRWTGWQYGEPTH